MTANILCILLLGLSHIYFEITGRKNLTYLTKPLTMIFILSLVFYSPATEDPFYQVMIIAALVLSLGGDICLMLKKERFILGVLFFALSHMVYLSLFYSYGYGIKLLPLVSLSLVGVLVLSFLWGSLKNLKGLVTFYIAMITITSMISISYGLSKENLGAHFVVLASLLFMLSDTLLGIRKFRGDFFLSPLWVMSSYFGAQTLFALSYLF